MFSTAAWSARTATVPRPDLPSSTSCSARSRTGCQAGGPAIVADEEALPFAEGRFDLAVSNLSLHWVNDLPGALLQVRRCLKPDGLFLAATLGGDTLIELRECLMAAEIELRDGASPRVSPFLEIRDAGALMQRAGFALPVIDTDTITVTYENALKLLADLRGMGETSAAVVRPREFTRKDLFLRMAQLYQERHAGPDGRINATLRSSGYMAGHRMKPSNNPCAPAVRRHAWQMHWIRRKFR